MYQCKRSGFDLFQPATLTAVLDATNYAPGARFEADDLLAFSFKTEGWSFSSQRAAGMRIQAFDHAAWVTKDQLPVGILVQAAYKLGDYRVAGPYLSFATVNWGDDRDYTSWGAYAGTGRCLDASCESAISGRSAGFESVAPVPLPPALLLMAAPLLAFAGLRFSRPAASA